MPYGPVYGPYTDPYLSRVFFSLLGGTISMTHAALLAENFSANGVSTSVIGIQILIPIYASVSIRIDSVFYRYR